MVWRKTNTKTRFEKMMFSKTGFSNHLLWTNQTRHKQEVG